MTRDPDCRGTTRIDPKTKTGKVKFFGCPQWQTAQTVCVEGRGDDGEVRVLFVGEAPGHEEDKIGKAFVGPAGRLFDAQRAEYTPNVRWYVTNATRCFPGKTPNNTFRKPSAAARFACLTHLENTIAEKNPEVLVAMGAVAAQVLLGVVDKDVHVSRRAGRIWSSRFQRKGKGLQPSIPVFVMRHPSWAVRDLLNNLPLWGREWEALARYLKTGSTGQELPGKWSFIEDQARLAQFYGDLHARLYSGQQQVLVVDHETTGLHHWEDRFTQIGYGLGPGEAVVVPATAQTLEEHKRAMRIAREVVLHNFPWDGTFLLGSLGILPSGFVWDTKALAYLVNENVPMSLEAQTDLRLPHLSSFKDESNDFGGAWGEMPPSVLARRCAYDCMATWQLKENLWPRLRDKTQRLYREVVEPALKTLCRMRVRGWQVDEEMLESLLKYSRLRARAAKKRIQSSAELTTLNGGKPLNPDSPIQVAKVLVGLGINDSEQMPNHPGLPSTAKDVLERHTGEHWLPGALLEYTQQIGHVERANHYKKYLVDGKLIPGYNWGGRARQDAAGATVTGRLSSAKPNVMNPPRAYRRCFISRFPGGRIISGDYSQLELRIVAVVAGEQSLLEEFSKPGGDPHGAAAAGISELVGTPVHRQVGKRLNFGAVYGAGPNTLFEQIQKDAIMYGGEGLNLTKPQVREMHKLWWDDHPACKLYMQRVHLEAMTTGEIEGLFGQYRRLSDALSDDPKRRGHALRQTGNFPVQNGGAILTLWAMAMVDREFMRKRMQASVIGQMHDSIIVDCPPDEVDKARQILRRIMAKEAQRWAATWGYEIPLDVEVKVGYDLRGSSGAMEAVC